ncbi:MAG: FtsB family cell division protein [Candidatus Binataceae bacterium]
MGRLSSYLRARWLNLILGAIMAALVGNCFVGALGPRDLLILRHHRALLESKRDQLQAENSQLTLRISKLRSDKAYLQRLIRRELGYSRPNELVYRFADPRAASKNIPSH